MQVESKSKPMLTVDEVELIQRKKVATIIGHMFQLTYAAFFDKLVQEEKVNRCHGCSIQHPSQRQHSCLMLDTEDAWFYYHDVARENFAMEKTLSRPKSTRKFRWFDAVYRAVKEKGKSKIFRKQVQDWLSQQDVYTPHKPARRHYKRSRVIVPDIDAQFQADLVDVQNLSRFNKGYKYLLTCIDIFSKYAWVVPLKTKQGLSDDFIV